MRECSCFARKWLCATIYYSYRLFVSENYSTDTQLLAPRAAFTLSPARLLALGLIMINTIFLLAFWLGLPAFGGPSTLYAQAYTSWAPLHPLHDNSFGSLGHGSPALARARIYGILASAVTKSLPHINDIYIYFFDQLRNGVHGYGVMAWEGGKTRWHWATRTLLQA